MLRSGTAFCARCRQGIPIVNLKKAIREYRRKEPTLELSDAELLAAVEHELAKNYDIWCSECAALPEVEAL